MSALDPRERWQEIDALFQHALDLPPEDRRAFVAEAADGDPELEEAVCSLLASTEDASDLLEAPLSVPPGLGWTELRDALGAATPVGGDFAVDRTGERVGAYRLERLLGRGGMASVYLGERVEGEWEQQVAVKVIRRGLDTGDVVRRFVAERQILSSLEHPHVARLLDGGTTTDGLPYLIMERVEGRPITSYCADESLSLRERLELFCRVAGVVDYAHRKLVVHRDLKPSNILVDERGAPRLLDFGIAKVLRGEGAGPDGRTRPGHRLLTPEYASPEQVRGDPVTTASDVYQLGVLLGVLICGERPHRTGAISPHATSLQKHDVTRPSRLVGDAFARSCGTSATRLRKQLRGDLDTIVLKALRERPEDRYPGVGAMRADIERHLAGRPIEARPATLRYRAGKLVRRRPWITAAIAGGALFLGGYGYTLVRHARQLEAERNLARLEAERARQVQEFLVGVFRSPDPYVAADPERGARITVRESLELGAERARRELPNRPALLASLLGAVGEVYATLGLYERARELHEEALALARETHGEGSAEVSYRLRLLGQTLIAEGRPDSAAVVLERGLALARERLAVRDTAVVLLLQQLGRAESGRGHLEEARVHFLESVTTAERLDPPPLDLLASGFYLLSLVSQDPQEGLRSAERALEMSLRAHGADHPTTGITTVGLAGALNIVDRSAEAVPHFRRGIDLLSRTLGPRHPDVLTAKGNLALSLYALGDYGAAEALQRELLVAYREQSGGDSSGVANTLQNLAVNAKAQGRVAEAEELLERAYTTYLHSLPEGHYRTAMPLLTQSEIQLQRRDYAGAEDTAGEALRVLSAGLPPGSYPAAVARCRLGRALIGRGRPEEGRFHLDSAATVLMGVSTAPVAYQRECLGALVRALDLARDGARIDEVQRHLTGLAEDDAPPR